MNCPKCHKPMIAGSDDDVSTCSRCSGTWVGGNSLHEFLHRRGNVKDIEAVFEELMDLEFRAGSRQCPECPDLLLKEVDFDEIELDYCTACKGMFFDPGELETVFSAAREPAPEPLTPEPGTLENLVASIRSWLKRDY